METTVGATNGGTGVVACGTGVGCLVGSPATALGVVTTAHGATVTAAGFASLMKGDTGNPQGQQGQPGTPASPTRNKATGPVKAKDAPGVTAGGQATDRYGDKLGPSGDVQVNKTRSNTREGARNKALQEGSGAVNHHNPKEGQRPHLHPADPSGNKKPSSTNHEYPEQRKG